MFKQRIGGCSFWFSTYACIRAVAKKSQRAIIISLSLPYIYRQRRASLLSPFYAQSSPSTNYLGKNRRLKPITMSNLSSIDWRTISNEELDPIAKVLLENRKAEWVLPYMLALVYCYIASAEGIG